MLNLSDTEVEQDGTDLIRSSDEEGEHAKANKAAPKPLIPMK